MEFEVGDKVELIENFNGISKGMVGVLKYRLSYTNHWAVEFNKPFLYGHTCNGKCKDNYGYYIFSGCLKLIDKKQNEINNNNRDFIPDDVEKIIMNKKNVTVILKNGNKSSAKIADKDDYDEFVGFSIAYYKAKNDKVFKLKQVLHNCRLNAEKKGYKQAILKGNGVN